MPSLLFSASFANFLRDDAPSTISSLRGEAQAIGRDACGLVQPNRAALAVARASKARSTTHHGRRCIQKGGRANRQGADKEDAVCGGGDWRVVTETEGLGRASKDTDATPPRRIYRRGTLPQVRRLCRHRVDTDDAEVGGSDHGAARGARGAPAVRAPAKGADDAYAPRISRTHARARTLASRPHLSLQPPPFFFIRSHLTAHLSLSCARPGCIEATEEKTFGSNEDVINQGDAGDHFYLVYGGTFEAYLAKSENQPVVASYKKGDGFGELALLYNSPRAASVRATSADAFAYALDRLAFRQLVMAHNSSVKHGLEQYLSAVPLLQGLAEGAIARLADVMTAVDVEDGKRGHAVSPHSTQTFLSMHSLLSSHTLTSLSLSAPLALFSPPWQASTSWR